MLHRPNVRLNFHRAGEAHEQTCPDSDRRRFRGSRNRQAAGGREFAAICAAPAVALHAYGVLKGRRVTCYPGMSDRLSGSVFVDQPVVVDGNCITSQGPATALEFALTLVERLAGRSKRREVAADMLVAG